MLVPTFLMDVNSSDARLISIVDMSNKYGKNFKNTDDYTFQVLEGIPAEKIKQHYEEAKDIYAILVIPANVEATHQVNIYSDNPVKMSLNNEIEDVLNKSLSDAKISSYDIPGLADIIEKSQISVSVKSHTWDDDGESLSSSTLSMIIGMGLAMLTYIFVLMYGAMIMSSVVEDKTNRIVEVIVSSCRPLELMLGKIVSIALVGLTQIAVWALFIGIGLFTLSIIGISAPAPDATAQLQGEMSQLPISEGEEIVQAILGVDWAKILVIFVLYFIGGYLLYASLFAGFGSAVDQQSDANQFMTPIMMIIILALLIGEGCMQDPDGTLGVICSFIPFTSPIVMMIRLPYDVPAWEIATSILLLYATALLLTFFAARIYRTGILMYGRKVTFKELLKWAR